jgi:lipopolysaccharide/colanic/teichoic acid biosynthesis glycosyltransferase
MGYKTAKRLFDLLLSLVAFVCLLPLILFLYIAIRLSSPGPAIFKQTRAGFKAKPFTLYKFRTMTLTADPFGPSPKSAADSRITPIGRFLRESSLDELPQLLNVIKGQMSMVGPRPLYIQQIDEWSQDHKRRLNVKPGLTGLAQVSGRGNLPIEDKLDLDIKYVDSASFWLDLKIIFATFTAVFGKREIYEKNYSRTSQTRGRDK